ncbi:helix-turn-helix domain-containing protein [Nonomuraea rubra]|uniref:AraC-like DNA-binding protein n=1 Tax=Nonomuraea rubra TaxID=46180 RepID=A0A7X0NNZ5_9ACTN|nr:helix-turn-helix domain-containing protein [Nonomuraea rubra]MBB6546993.1 AraC-like DNA-binding protein [Nonomuraea rubra]
MIENDPNATLTLAAPCWGLSCGADGSSACANPQGEVCAVERDVLLGALRLGVRRFPPLRVRAALRPSQTLDPGDHYHLLVPLQGKIRLVWDGRHTLAGVGQVFVHDVTRLQEADFGAGDSTFRTATVAVPRSLLSVDPGQAELALGRRLAEDGVGGLLAGFVAHLTDSLDACGPSDAPRLGMALLELVNAAFAHLGGSAARTAPSPRHALTLQIQAFIQRHLSETGLNPRQVAAAHHISVSYLHRLFHKQGYTVSGWIRSQRLIRTRCDLVDPALRDAPVHVIAARWGFSDPAVFSRAFRAAYGIAPSAFRNGPR